MFSYLYYPFRLVRIGIILGPAIKRKKLALALETLGPSFIKLGQTLSTRPDFLGEKLAADLATLRDQLPPFPTDTARHIIEDEFDMPLEGIFREFHETPVAAASIAQVHKAILHNGTEVAVKIVRPNVAKSFRKDIALFYWCAHIIERWFPKYRRLKPREVVHTLEDSILFELDLRYEAAAMEEMRANIKDTHGFRIPQVEWRWTSERVLVAEWISGTPIDKAVNLPAGSAQANAILGQLSEHFFLHVFRDGFFHADLHPGNLLIDQQGSLIAVDFGIMGRLNWRERLYVAEIFRGFLSEDYKAVARAHFRAGYVPGHHCEERFAQAAMAIAKPILGRPANEISLARLLGQLFNVAETFEMETQPQLLLLQKTLVVVEGVGRMLNPEVNMWEMARGPIENWARQHMGLLGGARHATEHLRELARLLPLLLRRWEENLRQEAQSTRHGNGCDN